jgi:hypothetical protein
LAFMNTFKLRRYLFPSPLMGEGQGGGGKKSIYCFLLSPSPYPPPIKGGGIYP